MAAIRERNGRYQARVRREGADPITKTFTRRRDAVAWARGIEADIEAGRPVGGPARAAGGTAAPTLAEAVRLFLAGPGARAKVAVKCRSVLGPVALAVFASKRIDLVTPQDLAGWRDVLAERLGAGSVRTDFGWLHRVFVWGARDKGWLMGNPCRAVKLPKAPPGRDRVLSQAEELALLHEAGRGAAWVRPAFEALLTTAMRRGELARAKVSDIDRVTRTLRVLEAKNGHPRQVPCSPRALRALADLEKLAELRGDGNLLPVRTCTVTERFTNTVRRARRAYELDCEQKGLAALPGFLTGLHLHDLRHTAITSAAKQGLSVAELQHVSGHRDVKMLFRYVNITATEVADKLAKLDNA